MECVDVVDVDMLMLINLVDTMNVSVDVIVKHNNMPELHRVTLWRGDV